MSKREWGKTRYAYAPGLRLRLDLPPGDELPPGPSTAWIGMGSKALRIDVTVVDRSEAPWASDPDAGDRP